MQITLICISRIAAATQRDLRLRRLLIVNDRPALITVRKRAAIAVGRRSPKYWFVGSRGRPTGVSSASRQTRTVLSAPVSVAWQLLRRTIRANKARAPKGQGMGRVAAYG